MKLFSELRRRNVLRMAVLYGVAAWLVMQVAEVITSLVSLPEWLGPTLITLLTIGFPIALIFSWLFEITPEGVSLEKSIPEGQSITRTAGRRMDFVIIAILSAGLILYAWDKWWPRGPVELSIAVLPFENMSADPEQEYFSDGISEEILNLLAQIQPLKVIARTSSFAFKGKNDGIAAIAQQLHVRHVLEGSVRRSGDRVRITAQLIDAQDSSHLWSQTFDRDYDAENLFTIQSEIARSITDRLRMTLTGEDEQRLANVPTKNTEAYTAYLIGRQRLTDRKVDQLADAVDQFARAIELDPQFAAAYSGLADACYLYSVYSGGQSHENCPPSPAEREQLARKAVELDPESGEAWVSLAESIRSQVDGTPESMPKLRESIAAFEHGLELNPNMAQGYHWYALALRLYPSLYPDPPWGWLEAWKAGVWQSVYDKGLEADPLSVNLHTQKSVYPDVAASREEAIRQAHRVIEIAPDSPRGYEILGAHEWNMKGRIDESIRWENKAAEIDPKHPDFPRQIGRAYSALGDPDMALAYFDLAIVLTSPENKLAQDDMRVEQAIIRLVSGKSDADQVAKAQELLTESKTWRSYFPAVFIELGAGRAADALARTQALSPECFAAESIEEKGELCQLEIVRIYQELDDQAAARDLTDAIIFYLKRLDVYEGWELPHLQASALACAGRTDEALDALEELVTSGWRDYMGRDSYLRFRLYYDVTFDAIRDEERFQAIVATIEADMAQQLENVREMQRRGEVPTLEELISRIASIEEATATTLDDPVSRLSDQ